MDFKREAIDKLRCYRSKQQSLQQVSDEITRLETEAVHIRSASAGTAAVSGGGGNRDDILINNIALRAELARAREATIEWLRIVDGALQSLTDEEREVLFGLYLNTVKGHVDRLCVELHIEKTALYKRRNDALRRFTLALYGVTEI